MLLYFASVLDSHPETEDDLFTGSYDELKDQLVNFPGRCKSRINFEAIIFGWKYVTFVNI